MAAVQENGRMSARPLDRFYACALQIRCDAVHPDRDRESATRRMLAAVARMEGHIAGAKRWIGADLKLIVLPEYVLTGPPWGESIAEWTEKAALDPRGREYEAIAACAHKHSVFIAGNAYETDPHFPGLYFQGCFLIDPGGARVLTYRRLISMFAPTPHDVWDAYLDAYGLEGVFPVADTVIGRISAIASEEILYPEVARCHAIRGAELFVHSTSETAASTLTPKQIARRARALENLAYVVSANNAELIGIDVAADSSNGYSAIVDYLGNVAIQAAGGESIVANASLDLAGLRAYRQRPGMGNMLSRQALELFAESFARADLRRRNGLLQGGKVVIPDRAYFQQRQAEALERMRARGIVR
jgi:predicted amidohydrolase